MAHLTLLILRRIVSCPIRFLQRPFCSSSGKSSKWDVPLQMLMSFVTIEAIATTTKWGAQNLGMMLTKLVVVFGFKHHTQCVYVSVCAALANWILDSKCNAVPTNQSFGHTRYFPLQYESICRSNMLPKEHQVVLPCCRCSPLVAQLICCLLMQILVPDGSFLRGAFGRAERCSSITSFRFMICDGMMLDDT